jgi:hypothetical protein
MESNFTPGPWRLIGKQGTAIWAGDSIIATVEGARAFHRIARANAQLIAAAPELLAAAQRYMELCPADEDTTLGFQAATDALRAAIAKATGAA